MNIYSDLLFYFQKYLDHYSLLFPIGIIGIWRWSVWIGKEIIGLNYHPDTRPYNEKVSLVTPVYNENPKVFTQALHSWKANNPAEIIAVIDYTDKACIEAFRKFMKIFPKSRLIVTKTPGKRPALADGIKISKYPIVALVDSDTIWAKDVIKNGLPPFNDKKVAGVATYQNVLNPKSFAQKIFDVQLDIRYRLEYPFMAAAGDALVCLSGRTAFYRRNIITPMLHDLVHETFLGKPVISGDDKRLTYLVLAAGWKVKYQSNSHVYTPGMKDLSAYTSQRLRWTRNSLRADIRAMIEGWPFKHPALAFFQIDKFLQSFVVILSPLYFLVSVFAHLWIPAIIIVVWWLVSRTIKMLPHLSRRPQDITILPAYVLYSFFVGILRIYALFTLSTQGWITRWDKSRLAPVKFLNNFFAYFATFAVILVLYFGVYTYKQNTYFKPLVKKNTLLSSVLRDSTNIALAKNQPSVLGASTTAEKDYSGRRYVVQAGETMLSISKKFGVDFQKLVNANISQIPLWSNIRTGTIITIPGTDVNIDPVYDLSYQKTSQEDLHMVYDQETNTIGITGRGQLVTLKTIYDSLGKNYLEEVSPKVWLLKSTIYVGTGVTLLIDKSEVTWLKLESEKSKYVIVRGTNANIEINGVKITSWDPIANTYDTNMNDGRSFVFIKGNGRMDIYNSELAYLGYPTASDVIVSPYGVSWKVSREDLKKIMLSGDVEGSKFHNNYFGAYTFGATGMTWRGNEFYSNIRYGLDPHDDSDGFLVENNNFHNNGAHGLIFSKRCMYNVIRNNYSHDNRLHGIMLHETSDHNLIYDNTLVNNTSGVALWHSRDNTVRNNKIEGNRHGVRADYGSNGNTIENNTITDSSLYGVYIYQDSQDNTVTDNVITLNEVGLYLRSNANKMSQNTVVANKVGVYFTDKASNNELADNIINNNTLYGVYSKVSTEIHNLVSNNTLVKNRKDMTAK